MKKQSDIFNGKNMTLSQCYGFYDPKITNIHKDDIYAVNSKKQKVTKKANM